MKHSTGPLILAIDDAPTNLQVLGSMLMPEFELLVATSGEMGLSLAKSNHPSLILLDILMPGMDGFETCKRLKADPDTKDIPVVFVSASTDGESEINGLKLGAADYIYKPVNFPITLQRIRNLLDRESLRKSLLAQRDILNEKVTELVRVAQELLETQTTLAEREAHLRAVILNEPECIKVVDEDCNLVEMNPAGLAMVEADDLAQVQGQLVLNLIAPEHRDAFLNLHNKVLSGESVQLVFEVQGLKGGRRWLETNAVPMTVQGKPAHLAITRDITERKQAAEKIQQLAFYDALTNLPNRRVLQDRLSQSLAAIKRNESHGALMYLDLDNFKPLNDKYGHDVGDLLLVEVASRMCKCVREMDTVSRFGGDEFVVLLSELDTDHLVARQQAHSVAEKIRVALAEPYLLTISADQSTSKTVEHRSAASVGVVVFNNQSIAPNDLIKAADQAMYRAKAAGRNTVILETAGG
jgi:diguanylate cyclase (GGDEF)-like protein/PAS domain S-box-containing protein